MPIHKNFSGAFGYKKVYEQGYKDGQEALAKHIELCKEENSVLEDIKALAIHIELCKEENSVLEDIKAEIAEEICLTDNPYTKETEYTISHKKVLDIIDKHISGK